VSADMGNKGEEASTQGEESTVGEVLRRLLREDIHDIFFEYVTDSSTAPRNISRSWSAAACANLRADVKLASV